MRSTFRRTLRSTALTTVLALTWNCLAHAARASRQVAAAQAGLLQPAAQAGNHPVPASPVPAPSARDRMLSAHTVYLASTGVDAYFGYTETALDNVVLNALQQWGRYQVAPDATHADLVLQVHGVATSVSTPGTAPDYTPNVTWYSSLKLTVADPHTLSPFWVVNTPILGGVRHKSRVNGLATSGENAVAQLKLLVGDSLTRQDQAGLKQIRTARTHLIVFGVVGAAAVAGFAILGIHLVHSNASNFCQAHNLSPCPGA